MPQLKPSPKLIELANQVRAGADLDWLARIEGLDSAQKSRIKDLVAPGRSKQKGAYRGNEQARLVQLHAQGLDAHQIAQQLGRSELSVTRHLHTQQLVVRPSPQEGIGVARARWCMEQLRARRLLQGEQVERLARLVGWSVSTWERRETGCVAVAQADMVAMCRVLGVQLVLVDRERPDDMEQAIPYAVSPYELAQALCARRVARGKTQQAQGALEGVGKTVIANRERCRQQERGQTLPVVLSWAGHLGLLPALRVGDQLVVWNPLAAVCPQPSQTLCFAPTPSQPAAQQVLPPRLVEELPVEESKQFVEGLEQAAIAQKQAEESWLYAELMRPAQPVEPQNKPRAVSSSNRSRLDDKRASACKVKAMRRAMQRNLSQLSQQLLDDLWDTASRYAACGHPQRALKLVRIATGQVRGQSLRRLVEHHRELDRERWEARQAILRADLAAVAHRGAPSVEEEVCSGAVFFAGVDRAEHPLVEVCSRLARLYAEQATLKHRQADPTLGDALIKRARLNLCLEVEYTDLDAQHVKRVLERIEGFERPDWSPLDHAIFARLKQLRGSCRL